MTDSAKMLILLKSLHMDYKAGGINMSEKEQLLQLIENVPDYKIGYVLAFVKGLLACYDTEK